ncbi:MAG: hypothetical protein IT439_02120 [Phycisphaerales bacterium]|nr:hypothetical protein [Phycisphaerales bacterium]
MAEPASNAAGSPNSLNLAPSELHAIRKRIAEQDDREKGASSHAVARWPLGGQSLTVRVTYATEGEATMRLAPRDLSAAEVRVFHDALLGLGSKCHVMLQSVNNVQTIVPGWVARCVRRIGSVYEASIRFDAPIEIRKYVAQAAGEAPMALHAANLTNLRGRVVYIDPSEFWTGQVRRELSETCIDLVCTVTAREGVRLAQQDAAAVLISAEITDMRPIDAILLLRAAGVEVPIVMLCPQGTDFRTDQASSQGVSVLPRPAPSEAILYELTEHLPMTLLDIPTKAKDKASNANEGRLADLILQTERTLECAATGDVLRTHGMALKLRDAAPAMGLSDLTRAAGAVAEALGQTMSIEESADALQELGDILDVMKSEVRKAA